MEQVELYLKQAEESQAYLQELSISYDKLRRDIVKSIWKMCRTDDGNFLQCATAMLDEVQRWEKEWGFNGRIRNALVKKHEREWHELADYHKMINDFRKVLPLIKN